MRKTIPALRAFILLAASLLPCLAQAQRPTVSFDLQGYHRTEFMAYGNLFDADAPRSGSADWSGLEYPHPERTHYAMMRGRLIPKISLADTVSLTATIDLLDGVLWGDNENIAATPLFAADPSSTQRDGNVIAPIQLRRLWLQWNTALGRIQVGRQPSNWGMGLLANHGESGARPCHQRRRAPRGPPSGIGTGSRGLVSFGSTPRLDIRSH